MKPNTSRHNLSREGSERPPGLLRLSVRALGHIRTSNPIEYTLATISHRTGSKPGVCDKKIHPDDDLQTGYVCREEVAKDPGIQTPGNDSRGSEVERRNSGRTRPKAGCSLMTLNTRLDHNSHVQGVARSLISIVLVFCKAPQALTDQVPWGVPSFCMNCVHTEMRW